MHKQLRTENFIFFLMVVIGSASSLALFVYPVIHETGHLLAAKIFGGAIGGIELRFIRAYALFSGNFTPWQTSIIDISGFALPYFIWAVCLLLLRKTQHWIAECLKLMFSVIVLGTMIIWILFPILEVFHAAPVSEDATKFTMHSSINGFVISGCFAAMAIFSILFLIKTTGNLKSVFESFLYRS